MYRHVHAVDANGLITKLERIDQINIVTYPQYIGSNKKRRKRRRRSPWTINVTEVIKHMPHGHVLRNE